VVDGVAIPFTSSSSLAVSVPSPSQVTLDQGTADILLRSLGNPLKDGTANLENLRETLRVLATLSRIPQNKAVLVSESTNLSDLLLSVLKLQDSEVRRCGVTLLSNVSTLESIRGELVSKLTACLFHLLANPDDSVGAGFKCSSLIEKEIQRQIARALAILSETHAADIARHPSYSRYLEILGQHKSSVDPTLRADIILTLEHLH